MTHPLWQKHQPLLDSALTALSQRGYWSAYSENPKSYGEEAAAAGKNAFEAILGKRFVLEQAGHKGWRGGEQSPYGIPLGVEYPQCDAEALVAAGLAALPAWQALGPNGRLGLCMEMLEGIKERGLELAHAVMMTTGQGWMMAFQAGVAHALDRGLEALACAHREMAQIPESTIWEKPQGKNPPLKMKKEFTIVGKGMTLAIGCATFPTWNTYPGLFAALATGNPVILKPHGNAILPVAITVAVIRRVLAENGLDPHLVSLFVPENDNQTQKLAQHPKVRLIDFTGGSSFGRWLQSNCPQAQVFAEQAGVNVVVIESSNAYRNMLKNLAFTLSLYSGQMCTTSQALLLPAAGIDSDEGHKSFDDVCNDLAETVKATLAKPEVALAVLGAVQSPATLLRLQQAAKTGRVVLASETLQHPDFPQAEVRTPLILVVDAADEKSYMEECFGPISFIVRCGNAETAMALAERIVDEQGALTASIYSTSDKVVSAMQQASLRAKVALSINLTGGVFVNQSAAFSDFHGTGANPAANASYTDSAFVVNRFVVVQSRYHV